MSRKNFVEDFSDLEIEREYVTKSELMQQPEVKKKAKQVKRSKVVVAVLAFAICVIGGISLLVFANGNAQEAISSGEVAVQNGGLHEEGSGFF